ncbi:MAG: MarR family transcriptional regulator [Phycisphaerae bacterium]|nr:MarR family transcriptional regulator [Phycisphaerae bacterium]
MTTTATSRPTSSRPEALFRSLLRTMGLVRHVMEPFFARFGISGPQWGILRVLQRAGRDQPGGVRVTDLSDRLLVRPPSVTGLVDRLERMGLVQRATTQRDRRVRRVRLTPEGRKLVTRIRAGHRRRVAQIIAGLDDRQQQSLGELLGRLHDHMAGLAPGGPGNSGSKTVGKRK